MLIRSKRYIKIMTTLLLKYDQNACGAITFLHNYLTIHGYQSFIYHVKVFNLVFFLDTKFREKKIYILNCKRICSVFNKIFFVVAWFTFSINYTVNFVNFQESKILFAFFFSPIPLCFQLWLVSNKKLKLK